MTSVPWIESQVLSPHNPAAIDCQSVLLARPPLAYLHANPAHSALRRVRHFSEAYAMKHETGKPVTGIALAYGIAAAVQLWSVR